MIWPAPGVTAEHLATTLVTLNGMPRPILAGAHSGDEITTKYLQWVNDASRMLGPVLRKADLDRLVYTPRYWAALANPATTPAVVGAVLQETEQRERDLDAALKEAVALRDHWAIDPRGTQVVVPDTGLFLNHVEEKDGRFDIATIAWRALAQARIVDEVRVVVPIVVIDEMELIKDNRSIAEKRRSKARWAVKHVVRLVRGRAGSSAYPAEPEHAGWTCHHRSPGRRAGPPSSTSE